MLSMRVTWQSVFRPRLSAARVFAYALDECVGACILLPHLASSEVGVETLLVSM